MKVMMIQIIKDKKDIKTIITEVSIKSPIMTNLNHIIKIMVSTTIHTNIKINIRINIRIRIRINIKISISHTKNPTINNNHSNRLPPML